MKKRILAAVILAMALLAGCGKEDGDSDIQPITPNSIGAESSESSQEAQESAQEQQQEQEPNTPAVASTETITDRPVVDGKKQSYLTGEWKDEEVVNRRSMAIVIGNNEGILPQYGLSRASIIYEAPVEGRISRLLCFFEDYDDLDHIGPVRSARDYFMYEALAYDSIFCNWGLARPWVEEVINSDRVDNVSAAVAGINKPADEAFGRLSRPGYKLEYTAYLFPSGYTKAVDRLGYAATYEEDGRFNEPFLFANDGHPATYDGYESAATIYPGGKTSNRGGYGLDHPYFVYKEDEGLYYRYQMGDAHIDEMNGEQLTVSNVVFKVCTGEERTPNDPDYDYLAFGVHGSGTAYVFTNGKVIKGTWKREKDYSANKFYDEKGNEIVFNQGKTWICCIWDDFEQYISYE